jgi:hypothetical protein
MRKEREREIVCECNKRVVYSNVGWGYKVFIVCVKAQEEVLYVLSSLFTSSIHGTDS